MKHIIRSGAGVLVAGLMAAGCSTSPPQSDMAAADTAIGNARHDIDQAANDPHVARYAQSELGRAQYSLHEAQATWEKHHDVAATKHWAYLAQQRAATARELANERAADESIRVAAVERDHAIAVAAASRGDRPAAAGQAQQALAGFATGKSTVPPAILPMIDDMASILKSNPDRKVVIEGHTDSTGSAAFNAELAMKRANAVRAALVERGVDPGRIVVEAVGEHHPVASNGTRAGRRENRRTDVIIAEPAAEVAGASQAAPGAAAMGQSGAAGQTGQGGGEQHEQPGQHEQVAPAGQQHQPPEQNLQPEPKE
jgi:outer membrane protein OmpA-like peptidoglycan-associated protein